MFCMQASNSVFYAFQKVGPFFVSFIAGFKIFVPRLGSFFPFSELGPRFYSFLGFFSR